MQVGRWVMLVVFVGTLAGCVTRQGVVTEHPPDAPAVEAPAPVTEVPPQPSPEEPVQEPNNQSEVPERTPSPAPDMRIPVLLYHHFEPDAAGENGAIISTAEFEWQMAWLKEQGYRAITTVELAAWLEGTGELPERPVLISFDDGYVSNLYEALPVLQRHGMKATIFMIGSYAGQQVGHHLFLSWPEIQALVQTGLIEIQSHTYDGHYKVGDRGVLVTWSSEERRYDLERLAEVMTGAGLPAPTTFAYPFGDFDRAVIADLEQMGYRLGFTVRSGFVRLGDDRFQLNRQVIFPGFSACDFERVVSGEPCR